MNLHFNPHFPRFRLSDGAPARSHLWLWAAGLLLLAAAFVGYLQPGLLLDFLNLSYCG